MHLRPSLQRPLLPGTHMVLHMFHQSLWYLYGQKIQSMCTKHSIAILCTLLHCHIFRMQSQYDNQGYTVNTNVSHLVLAQCNTNSGDILIWDPKGPNTNSTLQCCLLTTSLQTMQTSTGFSDSICTSFAVNTRFIHYSIGTFTPDFFFTVAVTVGLIPGQQKRPSGRIV